MLQQGVGTSGHAPVEVSANGAEGLRVVDWAGLVFRLPECLAASHQPCPTLHFGVSHQRSSFTCSPILTLGKSESILPGPEVAMSGQWSCWEPSETAVPKRGSLRSLPHPPPASTAGQLERTLRRLVDDNDPDPAACL